MRAWLNKSAFTRLIRARDGVAAAEFALFVPIFSLILIGTLEFGNLLIQSNAVEKGLSAGAMLAARSDLPISSADKQRIDNMVMTGNVDGDPPYLVAGWAEPSSNVSLTMGSFSSGGVVNLPIIRLAATVPYQPLIPGLMSSLGFGNLTLESVHEQAYLKSY